jgi:hypothetical protein
MELPLASSVEALKDDRAAILSLTVAIWIRIYTPTRGRKASQNRRSGVSGVNCRIASWRKGKISERSRTA